MNEIEVLRTEVAAVRQFVKDEERNLTGNPGSREALFFLNAKRQQLAELEEKLNLALGLRTKMRS